MIIGELQKINLNLSYLIVMILSLCIIKKNWRLLNMHFGCNRFQAHRLFFFAFFKLKAVGKYLRENYNEY